MSERIGVVGNRKGANLQSVVAFIDALHDSQPDSIVVSGGAKGVDALAESTWYRLGGRVRSYRPVAFEDGYGIEIWNYSAGSETSFVLGPDHQRVSFATYGQACLYRDWLIAEDCDKLVAFYRDSMAKHASGTAFTASLARDRGIAVYDYVADRVAA